MRFVGRFAPFPAIPLFAQKTGSPFSMLRSILPAASLPSPLAPFVPLGHRPAGARSEGQGRPQAGAPRAPLSGASTLAGWRRSGVGSAVAVAILLLAPGAAVAQDVPTERGAVVHPYAGYVADAARRFAIPEAWIWEVMRAESNGDARAVSTAGAMGLMQIMPATWAQLRARYGLGTDPFGVRDNIVAGAAYLRELYDRYGDVTAMLAAYNAGTGRTDDYLSRGRPLPGETRAYLARLASITGANDSQLAAVSPASDPFAWRRAALFVSVASASEPSAKAPPPSNTSAPNGGVLPQSPTVTETLFVPRAGAGRPQ